MSSTWRDKQTWSLNEEAVLGVSQSAAGNYGYDVLGVQIHDSSGGAVTLTDQVIAGIATKDFYLGNLGLAPRKPAFSDSQNPSFLKSLKNESYIPSLAYGYTAGAFYRNKTASLTLGGYDASRRIDNDVSFTLAAIETHDLVVGIQSITFSNSSTANVPLMQYGTGVLAFIDSTLPNLWLPPTVCFAFEQAFGLIFDEVHQSYTINESAHDTNLKTNANVAFQLGNSVTGGKTVNITLPYASFDLTSTSVINNKTSRYFPLKQADNGAQYTLGRTFLQEAFLSVDYERRVFNVSQADFSDQPSHIIAIPPFNASETGSGGSSTANGTPGLSTSVTVNSQSSGLSSSAIAGIAVGIVVLAITLASAVIFVIVRKRRRDRRPRAAELSGEQNSPTGFAGHSYYNPFTKHHHNFKRSAAANMDAVEHAGMEIAPPQMRHVTATASSPTELQAAEVLRAELHSPEPPVSPQSEKPGMDLPMDLTHDMAHTPQIEPSTPIAATPSAFRSPTIGYTRFDDVTTPPALSPESDKDHYFPHR